ncbi:unnamed protein product [Prunus armeniaca]
MNIPSHKQCTTFNSTGYTQLIEGQGEVITGCWFLRFMFYLGAKNKWEKEKELSSFVYIGLSELAIQES